MTISNLFRQYVCHGVAWGGNIKAAVSVCSEFDEEVNIYKVQ